MGDGRDWYDWHLPYADAGSPLARRLLLVRRHIAGWLDERPDGPLSVVSVCAGQGHDLLGVLAARPADARRVRARLIEYDPRNVAAARAGAAAERLDGVTVVRADAGDPASYAGVVPADLVLLAGVLGNVSDADARETIGALPELCAPGATVIWTRTRRAPDLTPAIRTWLADAGFAERAFHAPQDVLFSVGVHRLLARPRPLTRTARLFRFAT
ncbi:class I SAM-dependent methyltransferase family protein [Micromonospora sp. B11E3]|uniref:class I SAM-dependent methyltransferase family protein n=1 Tax=Micromonospora sp. B11E3 TaxID=3153562 RepID=UPI00325F283A